MSSAAHGILHIAMATCMLIIVVMGINVLTSLGERLEETKKVVVEQHEIVECLVLYSKGEVETCE